MTKQRELSLFMKNQLANLMFRVLLNKQHTGHTKSVYGILTKNQGNKFKLIKHEVEILFP